MRADELRLGRRNTGLTQAQAAARLGLSQPYLSLLERGRRPVPRHVARAAAKLYRLPPTTLPVPSKPPKGGESTNRLSRELAALGYPGYGHLRPAPPLNPAFVVLNALAAEDLDARLTEALPWVLVQYPQLDWEWLVSQTKLRNLQNRLGFLVSVARELAEQSPESVAAAGQLAKVEQELERARLVAETTLSLEAMPAAEREWLREHRPSRAAHWNVLSSMTPEQLPYAR